MTEEKLQMRRKIRDLATAVAETRGDDPEVRRQVVALIDSLDDTLPDEVVLEELKALKEGGPTFRKLFADNSPENRATKRKL
jgi:hypothetical protein